MVVREERERERERLMAANEYSQVCYYWHQLITDNQSLWRTLYISRVGEERAKKKASSIADWKEAYIKHVRLLLSALSCLIVHPTGLQRSYRETQKAERKKQDQEGGIKETKRTEQNKREGC